MREAESRSESGTHARCQAQEPCDGPCIAVRVTDGPTLPWWKLRLYQRNALKVRDAKTLDRLCTAILGKGFCFPVFVWAGHNYVIDGAGRMPALERLEGAGHIIPEEIPVSMIEAESEREAAELVLLASSHHGAVTEESIADFSEIHALQLDQVKDMVAFQGVAIEEVVRKQHEALGGPSGEGGGEPDEIPEPPAGPVTKPGDLWVMEEHRLLCGDSTKREDVGRVMEGGVADMLLTDPPYGVSYFGKTVDALEIENDNLSEADLASLVLAAFSLAEESTRAGAYWYATVPPGPLHLVFALDWKQRGILRQILIWDKDSMVLGHSEYHYKHEPILFGWRPGGKRHRNADRTRTTVWACPRPKASREHPTMKPVELWSRAVEDGSRCGESIYDPFAGSGTTIISAEKLSRRCYGIEISPAYCDVIVARWENYTGRKAERVPA